MGLLIEEIWMGQLKKSPGVKPAVDLFTGVLILSVVVGLPVVGLFYL